MKTKLVILSLLFFSCTYAQTGVKVSEQDYYNFFDSVSNPLGETHFILQSEPIPFDVTHNSSAGNRDLFDTIFPKSDSSFLIEQAYKGRGFFWGPGMIYGSRVVSRRDMGIALRQLRNNVYSSWGYWAYSIPLFSSDKTICLVKYCNFCGEFCVQRYVYYYKKEKGKWKAIYHYRTVKE